MSEENAHLLSEQAEDRREEFEVKQATPSPQSSDRLETTPSQAADERRRLRQAADLADRANQLAQEDDSEPS